MSKPRQRRLVILGAMIAGTSMLGLLGCTAATNLIRGGTTNVTPMAKTGSVAVGVSMPSVKREISAIEDSIDHITLTVAAKDNVWTPPLTATFNKTVLGTASWRTFSAVPVGKVLVTAAAYDSSNHLLKTVTSSELDVLADQVTNATLELKWDVGGVSAQIKITIGSAVGLTIGSQGAYQALATAMGGASRWEDTLTNPDGSGNHLSGAAYACGTCHADVQDVFKTAAHNVWEPKLSANCFPCHTVGYDPALAAGSMLLNGAPVGFDSTKPATDSANLPFLGIQCETCHGAGSSHIASASVVDKLATITRRPSYSDSCLRCHMDSWNKVDRMKLAASNVNNVKPSFPIYMVSNEDVNSGGSNAFLRHGKQSEVYLGGGGYLFNDGNTPNLKATAGTAATFPLNPMTAVSNPHRDSVDNGCITCHMNAADGERHNPAIKEKRAAVVSASCQTCHGTGFTAASIANYEAATDRDLATLSDLLIKFRQTHATQVLDTSSSAFTKATRVNTASGSVWTTDVASLSLAVSCWDDSPAFVQTMWSDNASMSSTTNFLGATAQRGWSTRMTTYNAAWWNYVLMNGMTTYSNTAGVIAPGSTIGEEAGGIHNPAYSKKLIRETIAKLRASM